MNFSRTSNLQGELITLDQACALTNLGQTKIRQLAAEAGAVVKIGKSYRIKRQLFLRYIEKTFSVR